MMGTRQQEPWAFDKKTLALLRHYIQLRYRLRPYLYQLFARQEQTGEAILRPLFYAFEDTAKLPLGHIDDQFMVGPWILQAPFVEEKLAKRSVVLPGKQKWYDINEDRWISGGRKITVQAKTDTTPIYIRDGAIIPLARQAPKNSEFQAGQVDFRIFLSGNGKTSTRYLFDDGATLAYKKGKRSEVEIVAERKGTGLAIESKALSNGYGIGDFTFTTGDEIKTVSINGTMPQTSPSQGIALGRGKTVTWK